MFCYTHLKKSLKDNDQNITEANIKRAMKRPIKVNRHKGGRVDIYFCGSVGSSVPGGLGSNPVLA